MRKIYNKNKLLRYFLLIFFSCLAIIDIQANDLSEINIEGFYSGNKDELAGISSLMSATANNDIEGVEFFLKNNLNLINSKNIGGATALHIACREQNLEIVEILIKNKANINLQDNEGWTPLMRASLAGDKEIVKLLIKNGAVINYQNKFSESAIFHSAQANCEECFEIILNDNLKIKEIDFSNIKKNILSAIETAKKRDNQEIISLGSLWLEMLSKKIKNKAKNNNSTQKIKDLQKLRKFNIKNDDSQFNQNQQDKVSQKKIKFNYQNEANIPQIIERSTNYPVRFLYKGNREDKSKFNFIFNDDGNNKNLSYKLNLDSAPKSKQINRIEIYNQKKATKNFVIKKDLNKKYQLKSTLDNKEDILKKNNLDSDIIISELPSIVAESYIK